MGWSPRNDIPVHHQISFNEKPRMTLSFLTKLAYGVGHVHNDIAATICFSFSLLYMQGILGLSKFHAGLVLLLGQIFDALFNIVLGAESDKISLMKGYGRRKGWHLFGSVLCIGKVYKICLSL